MPDKNSVTTDVVPTCPSCGAVNPQCFAVYEEVVRTTYPVVLEMSRARVVCEIDGEPLMSDNSTHQAQSSRLSHIMCQCNFVGCEDDFTP